ncbi:MAG: hypothetical protein PHR77_21640 [Kiritimatiellae bacterium]|nr:hypothetical protein [Kiritimatiellia bacterium]MDD5523126.1 hypothetical protein [Kiritimatiellia bacterium]
MSKRNREQSDAVSLFPFLSILTCLIGTLTMLIAALALRQISPGDKGSEEENIKAEARLTTFKQIQAQINADKNEIERLKKLIEELEKQLRRITLDSESLKKKKVDLEKDIEKRKKVAEIATEAGKLKTKADQLNIDIARVKKEIEAKQAELAKKKKPVGATVTVRPSGSATGLKPFFIECTSDSIVTYDSKESRRISKTVLKTDAAYASLLERVKSQPDSTIIFLVRSGGILTFLEASTIADAAGTRYGKLPVVGDGMIDLGLFDVNSTEKKP